MGVFTHSNSKKTTQMKKTQCILVAALLLLAACAPKEGEFAEPRFRKVEHRDFTILGEELMLSVVGSEAAWRDHLILLSDDMATRNNIHIYSKRTGAWELSALPAGRAAGEITLATDIQVMGDTLYVFDNNPPRLKKYLLPALLAREPMSEVFLGEIPMSDRGMHWAGVAPDRMVVVSTLSPVDGPDHAPRILWTGPDGPVATYDAYPYEDRKLIWTLYSTAYPYFALSPDGSKLVLSTTWGSTVELFRLSDGEIVREQCLYWVDPEFVQGKPAATSRVGTSRILATDSGFITAFYSKEKDFDSGREACDRIAFFDWEGRGLRCIQLSGYSATPISYDEQEGTLLALLWDGDNTMYLGKMALK